MLGWAARHLRRGGVAAWIVPRARAAARAPGWALIADVCEGEVRMRVWRCVERFT